VDKSVTAVTRCTSTPNGLRLSSLNVSNNDIFTFCCFSAYLYFLSSVSRLRCVQSCSVSRPFMLLVQTIGYNHLAVTRANILFCGRPHGSAKTFTPQTVWRRKIRRVFRLLTETRYNIVLLSAIGLRGSAPNLYSAKSYRRYQAPRI